MDPQKLSQLDPKLREAYQRVMGTSVPQSPPLSAPDPTPTPKPTPTPNINPAITSEEPPTQPQPPMQPLSPLPEPQPAITPEPPQQPPVQATKFDQMNSVVSPAQTSPNLTAPAPQAQTIPQKKKSNLMPILIGIVILVFIAVYALFWTKIFNFKLPFLPF